MAKMRDFARGKRARKVVPATMHDGTVIPGGIALVPLLTDDEADVVGLATAWAEGKGSKAAKPGDPLFERGLQVFTILRSCMDPDSPELAPEPFFASAEEIGQTLDPDRVTLLYFQQRAFQDKMAPPGKDMEPYDFVRMIWSLASEEEDPTDIPFDYLPRAAQRSFLRTAARTCANLPEFKSLVGLLTPAATRSFVPSFSISAAPLPTEGATPTPEKIEPAPEPPAHAALATNDPPVKA